MRSCIIHFAFIEGGAWVPISYRLSTTRWPIVDVIYKGLLQADEVPALLAEASLLLDRKEPFIMIHDSRSAEASPRKHRYLISDWVRDHDKALREHCIGSVIILESLAVRLALQFILMISPLPNETHVCRTTEDAEEWSAACFKRNGLDEHGRRILQRA